MSTSTRTKENSEETAELVRSLAYQLRTPLAVIKTNTEILLLEKGVTADSRDLLEQNAKEIAHISNIISTFSSSLHDPARTIGR